MGRFFFYERPRDFVRPDGSFSDSSVGGGIHLKAAGHWTLSDPLVSSPWSLF